jgi:hypothetical protein
MDNNCDILKHQICVHPQAHHDAKKQNKSFMVSFGSATTHHLKGVNNGKETFTLLFLYGLFLKIDTD